MKAMQGKLNKNVKFHDVGISHRRDEMKTMMFQDMLDVNGDYFHGTSFINLIGFWQRKPAAHKQYICVFSRVHLEVILHWYQN